MKYYKTLNQYKNSRGTNVFDMNTGKAYSYDWWLYFTTIDGIPVFNSYRYSPSTSKHQANMRLLLDELGVREYIDVECPNGLQDLDSGIDHYQAKINSIEAEIAKPRSKPEKNSYRKELIKFYKHKLDQLEILLEASRAE